MEIGVIVSWGIRYASAQSVKNYGELADEANIWQQIGIDPPFTSEEAAWEYCESEDACCDHLYVHRPYSIRKSKEMKNPLGLVHIETGGSANTTNVTIDGFVSPMVKRATIEIDPALGENKITLECYSRQKNHMYEDGETQVFCGISSDNYEFFKQALNLLSEISDEYVLRHSTECLDEAYDFWNCIKEARKKAWAKEL